MSKFTDIMFVEAAFLLLQENKKEDITIRKIASELGCSSAALYKRFDSLEHLLCFACLKYLSPYLKRLNELMSEETFSEETYLSVWESFIDNGFSNPEVFESIFFGSYTTYLSKTLARFYSMYGLEAYRVKEKTKDFLEDGDIFTRDYILLSQCIEPPCSEESIAKVSRLNVFLFEGMLRSVLEKRSPIEISQLKEECMESIKKNTIHICV